MQCNKTAVQPAGSQRQDLRKDPALVRRACQVWAVDELQIVSEETGNKMAGYHKILLATCCFSHFVVIQPIKGNLTQEMFMDFINQRIIQIWGSIHALVTDNAGNLSGQLVQDACSVMNINKVETNAYIARSNVAELCNKILLDMLRNMVSKHFANPAQFNILLTECVVMINALPFKDNKLLSPYLIMHGQVPKIGIYTFCDIKNEDVFQSKDDYFITLLEVKRIFNELRREMISERQYFENTNKAEKYYNQIIPSSIVTLQANDHYRGKNADRKLKPRYKYNFVVTARTKSSAFIRPCDNISINHFLENNGLKKMAGLLPVYKCDISKLKVVTPNNLLMPNNNKKLYRNFLAEHIIPEPLYITGEGNKGTLRTWDKIDDIDCLEELNEADKILNLNLKNYCRKLFSIRKIVPRLEQCRTKDKMEILRLVKHLSNIKTNHQKQTRQI